MDRQSLMMVIIACIVILTGIFMAVKGKPSMVRERFSSGVSPENERKFMVTIGGGVSIIGLDMLALGICAWKYPMKQAQILIVLAVGIILSLAVVLYGQKHYRK